LAGAFSAGFASGAFADFGAGFSATASAFDAVFGFAAAFSGAASAIVSGFGAALAAGALMGVFAAGLVSAFDAGRASVRAGFAAGAATLRAAGRAASGAFTGAAVLVLVLAAGFAAAAACVFEVDFIVPAEVFPAGFGVFSGEDFAFGAGAGLVEVMSSPLDFGLASALALPFSVILDAAAAAAAFGADLAAWVEAASLLAIMGTLRLLTTNSPWR